MRSGGFYWVRDGDGWVVAEWYEPWAMWRTTQTSDWLQDSDFLEIDERPIVRDKKELPGTPVE